MAAVSYKPYDPNLSLREQLEKEKVIALPFSDDYVIRLSYCTFKPLQNNKRYSSGDGNKKTDNYR